MAATPLAAPDRRGSDSIKWGKYAGRDVLPLWVADMDFAAPPAVIEALHQRVEHGVFGYAAPWPSLTQSVLDHLAREYHWAIEPDWLVWLPGLVSGLNVACQTSTGGILANPPIYPPFLSAPRNAGRPLISVPLQETEQRWHLDWPAMHAAALAHKPPQGRHAPLGLYLFCHPHNPVGRAWTRTELLDVADFCCEHDLQVCSDEIHCGLMLEARQHIPLASLNTDIAQRSITLMAPSKTYNVPGLGCAFAVIPNPALKRRFLRAMEGIVPHVNVLGLVACEAALNDTSGWHRQLIDTLRQNRDRLQQTIQTIPGLRMSPVEATYLAWLDVHEWATEHDIENPHHWFESKGLGLSDGLDFGAPGWMRLNFGCQPMLLTEACQRLLTATSAA